jgi:transposase-like protein
LTVGHKRDGRNVYDNTKKAQLEAHFQQPGVSIAKVALANSINDNLAHPHGKHA